MARRRKRTSSGLLLTLVIALAATLTTPAPAEAATFASFEIDGNRADDSGPGDPVDWDTPPPNQVTYTDATGQGDDVFGIGSKELEPGGWSCISGSAPGKDDITGGAIAFRRIAGKQYMYVNFVRAGTNGDAHMDYEFNQSTVPNPACPALPSRTPGDTLVTFDTENGGSTIVVRLFRWSGDATAGTFTEVPLAAGTYAGAVNIPPSKTIPGVADGAFGEAALNLTDTIGDIGCGQFLTAFMKTRASTAVNAAIKDRTASKQVGFAEADPAGANAHDSAYGAHVDDTLAGIDQTLVPVRSEQHGPGSSADSDQVLNAVVPPTTGEHLRADALRTLSTSTVTAAPPEATHTSTSEAVNVNVLGGLVTASLVRGVAATTATPTGASLNATGSAFKDLTVNGVAQSNVTPNTRIDLPEAVYGPGSYVLLFERVGSTSSPRPGQVEGGTFAADLKVNMINVHITDKLPAVPGDQTANVIVADAVAHSDFPQRPGCAFSPNSVSGHAYVGRATTDPGVSGTTVGYVDIPSSGGHDHQDLNEAKAPVDGSGVTTGTAVSDSAGTVGDTAATASSYAQAEDVCVLRTANGCTVSATTVKSQANSTADAARAGSDDTGTVLAGVSVLGSPVTPARNTTITLPDIGYVVLNEQSCDGATALPGCSGPGHTGLTVRAVHVVVTRSGALGLPAGAEIIVAEAHSDASFA